MSGVQRLILPNELCRQMFLHARAAQPHEAVGLLGGTADGQARCVLKLPNLASSNKQFIADPFAQFCAFQRLKSEQLELLGIYHSHPGGGIEPSKEDLEHARRWAACAHLIIAFGLQGECPDRVGAFRFVSADSSKRVEVPIFLI